MVRFEDTTPGIQVDRSRRKAAAPVKHRASQRQGWGLGLTAVKEIAEAHGGSVVVESTAEEGTTFTLQVFRDAREFGPNRPGLR